MPSPRTTKAVKDILSALTGHDASPKTGKKRVRVHDLSRHKEDPLEFLQELKSMLRVVDSARKYGIGWRSNEDGQDVVTLGDPLKFQKLLRKGHDRDDSDSTDALLEAFDKSMIRLGFEVKHFRPSSSSHKLSPRTFKNRFFTDCGASVGIAETSTSPGQFEGFEQRCTDSARDTGEECFDSSKQELQQFTGRYLQITGAEG
ncbi:MAG: hypothetical protein SGARI_003405 [Bacillariaceae sp.]